MRSTVVSSCVLALASIACSRQEPAAQGAAPAPTAAAQVVAEAAPSPARVAQPVAAPPIATAEGEKPGVRAEVTELKRGSGDTVTLKFTVINDTSDTAPLHAIGLAEGIDITAGDIRIGGVHLIDPVGKKKYFVARDSENKCVCSYAPFIKKGERANLWAKLAAPPDAVERVSVVLPTFSPLDDVPITR